MAANTILGDAVVGVLRIEKVVPKTNLKGHIHMVRRTPQYPNTTLDVDSMDEVNYPDSKMV